MGGGLGVVADRPAGSLATFGGTDPDDVSAGASLLARAAAALRDGASVIGVDDAHLLDAVSAALLHQLVADGTIRLVVTVRDGEPSSDAVTALWKDGLLARVDVPPLNREQSDAVVVAGLGGPVDGITLARLFDATRGNVLWLRQLVDGERSAERLARTGGLWHWSGDPELSPALATLVAERIGRLPAPEHGCWSCSRSASPSHRTSCPVWPTPPRWKPSSTAASPGWTTRGAASARTPAVRRGGPAGTGPLRARRLRGTLAEAITADTSSAGVLRRAVLHHASDQRPDPGLLLAGAVQAAGVADFDMAARLAGASRDAGGGFEAHLVVAFLATWGTRGDEAEAGFAAAAQLASSDADRIRAAVPRAANLAMLDRAEAGLAMLDAVPSTLDDPARAADLDAGRAIVAAMRGDAGFVDRTAGRVLADPAATPVVVGYAGWAAAIAGGFQAWDDVAAARFRRGVEACGRSADTAALGLNLRYWEVTGLALAGEVATGRARAEAAAADTWSPAARHMVAMLRVPVELAAGRVRTVARICRDALLYLPGPRGGWVEMMQLLLGTACGCAGDATGASAALEALAGFRSRDIRAIEPQVTLAHAWASAAQGALTEAVARARVAGDAAAAAEHWAVESAARHAAVCFGDREQADRLAALADRLPGPRPLAAAAHAAALAADDPARLLAASAQLESPGLLLLAADAAAQAATALRRAGRPREGLGAAIRAADLAARCEDARTPALTEAMAPLPITSREREVATLASAGLTNRQIGEQLHVSVRTVEGHVYRACTKLGLDGRASLAALVGRHRELG